MTFYFNTKETNAVTAIRHLYSEKSGMYNKDICNIKRSFLNLFEQLTQTHHLTRYLRCNVSTSAELN